MRLIAKIPKKFIYGVLILSVVFFVTRLVNLLIIPIFTDEAIYIRWSQIGAHDASWRFISLTDGKQPFFTWITMFFLKIFNNFDPLFVGRFAAVIGGFVAFSGLGILAYLVSGSYSVVLVSLIVYILNPFNLFYDRLALYESWTTAFSLLSLNTLILVTRKLRLDIAMIHGFMLAAGMLNKTSGFLSFYLSPVCLLLLGVTKKNWKMKCLQWCLYLLIAFSISQLLYSILRLSPYFHMIKQKDGVFVYTFSEWLRQPILQNFKGNLIGLTDWFIHYLSIPFLFAIAIGIYLTKKSRETYVLLLWFFLPFVALALFGKVLYPRYILFMTTPLLVIASFTIHKIIMMKNKIASLITILVLLGQNSVTSYLIITNPLQAAIPKADQGQILLDWPSGWGIKEVVGFLSEKAKTSKISVYTEGTFGLMPYALELYLVDKPNISIHGVWPLPKEIPDEVASDSAKNQTYFVLNETQIAPYWLNSLQFAVQKGTNSEKKLRLYKVD